MSGSKPSFGGIVAEFDGAFSITGFNAGVSKSGGDNNGGFLGTGGGGGGGRSDEGNKGSGSHKSK